MPRAVPDLRMPALGLAAWLGGLAAHWVPWPWSVGVLLVLLGAALGARERLAGRLLVCLALLLVAAAVLTAGLLRQAQASASPVAELARERAVVTLEVQVTSDPREVAGRFADSVLLRADVTRVTGRGAGHELSVPVLLVADPGWLGIRLGSTLRIRGRLDVADDPALAAVVVTAGPPEVVQGPDVWWRGAEAVRASIRDAVTERPPSQRALVPALVDGDDAGLDPDLADDFRTTGLTHLLAVSGTNLTLVVGFLLILARWCGVRGRSMILVGAIGIAGFVLLARTEPSVVRAAAMGSVALLAMGTDGRERGARALGAAVVALLLVDPALASSVGFALSVVATAGILFLAPAWRDALARWLPRWAAEAIAVPATAQLACTPLVAAISGQVSLVAVAANLAAAPAIAPATVLGLAAGLVGLVWPAAGELLGTLASGAVAWIVTVARTGADLPTAAVGWGTGISALALLTVVVVALALLGPRLLARAWGGAGAALLLVVAVLTRPPTPGWPADGWVLAACDVGQGDALALRAGPGEAVVVDAGPDPVAVDACLDRLDVRRVPLVVLTHFHADHVDGLAGVMDGRDVGAVEVSPFAEPDSGVSEVEALARGVGLGARPAVFAGTRTIGDVTLQVLWPLPGSPTAGPSDGSSVNDASVVLLAEVRGVRLLLAGDVEPDAQAALARAWPGLAVDVLKVPHHGSRYQDTAFLGGLGARVAVVTVGEGNDYGHPAPETLAALDGAGAEVLRTDLDGDVLVAVRDGRLATVTSD